MHVALFLQELESHALVVGWAVVAMAVGVTIGITVELEGVTDVESIRVVDELEKVGEICVTTNL